MNHSCLIPIWLICLLLIAGCADDSGQDLSALSPETGSIVGNVSPINVYDAEITMMQNEDIIAIVGVQDGVFQIDDLPVGEYDLRVSALGYVTNDAIKGIKVISGEITDIGRVVIFPEDTGQFIPTRITGLVRDSKTQQMINQASVEIECSEGICGLLNGATNEQGQFSIAVWANLASVVTVSKAGYRSARVEVVGIPNGLIQSIEVELEQVGF